MKGKHESGAIFKESSNPGYKLVIFQIIYSLLRWWSTLAQDNCLDMQSCCSKEGKKNRYPVSYFQHVQDFENIPLVDLMWHIYIREEGADGGQKNLV